MPATERLQSDLGDAISEQEAIRADGVALYAEIRTLVLAFAAKHKTAETDAMLEHTDGAIGDMVSDACGPAWRRQCRIENEIGRVEDADMRRNAAIVL